MAGNDDINQLKQILENLSGEPQWREKRGEAIEDVVVEEAPQIEREAIVREADLNRPLVDNMSEDDESQMSDIEKKDEPQAESLEQFDEPSDNLANMEDPGLDNLKNEIDNDDLDLSSIDNFNLEEDFTDTESKDIADSLDLSDLTLDTQPPIADEDVELDGLQEAQSFTEPQEEQGADLQESIEPSLEPLTQESSLNSDVEDSANAAAPPSDDAPAMDEMELPDLDEPLNMFEESAADDDALFAMGEADESRDLSDFDDSRQGDDASVEAVDLLMEGDFAQNDDGEIDFNLGDFGNLEMQEEKSSKAEEEQEELEEDEEEDESFSDEDLVFSQRKIDQINEALARLPRNLRLALHKILASEESEPETIYKITQKLLKGASARSLANDVREVTGQTIILPSRYRQNSGEEFERRKQGFVYNFKQFAWPVLRPVMVGTVLVALLFLALFSFLYRPLTAAHYYRTGYGYILENDYEEALLNFSVAYDGWRLGFLTVRGIPMQRWFFRYAEAFTGQRQYTQAQQMYERLIRTYPTSQRAFLEYGSFESRRRANFERADQIYLQYLNDVNLRDQSILLARSENLLRWGAHDASRLPQAKAVYATLIDREGLTDRTIMGLLEFAVLTNNRQEIEVWSGMIKALPKMNVDPEVLILTAGWFIDQGRLSDAEDLMQKAIFLNERDPILHYHLARFHEESGDLFSARNSLNQAIYLIQNSQPMTRQDTDVFIDIFRRSSALRFKENILDERAQSELERAIAYYENGVERRIIGRNGQQGGMYKELGDIFYVRDQSFRLAAIEYEKALANLFDDADLRYKRGYIAYNEGDTTAAINELGLAFEMAPGFKNAAFGLATVLAVDNRFVSSEAFYQGLRAQLERDREALIAGESVAELALRRENGEYLMKVYNNLGVVLNHLAQQRPNRVELQQQAQIAFQQAMFLWDALSRDPESRARVVSQELPGINFRQLLHPTEQTGADNLYDAIPMFIDTMPVSWGF